MPTASKQAKANQILAALSRPSFRRMIEILEPVQLEYGQVIYEPLGPIEDVYFPIDCLVSLLTAVDDNRTLEVGMVGDEGMIGMPMALGIEVSAVRALVQGGGTALRMSAGHFRREFRDNVPLQRALFRYNHLLMAQISQTAACNRFHETTHRLARWLLMTRDRLHADEFVLTHEFLSHMLGVRRSGVSIAACALQEDALISYSRGKVKILNPARLEAAACSCYRTIKDLQDLAQKQGQRQMR